MGKVVKSHCAGQPEGRESSIDAKNSFFCQPVIRAVQVCESRKKCQRGAKLVQGAVGNSERGKCWPGHCGEGGCQEKFKGN